MKKTVCHRRARAGRRLPALLGTAAVALLPLAVAAAPPGPSAVAGEIAADAVWEGTLLVEGTVTVLPAATLTVRPGTELHFRPSASIVIQGTLRAEGSAEAPVTMAPEGDEGATWGGLTFAGESAPSLLSHCRIRGAGAVGVARGEVRIEGCEITGGLLGVSVNGEETAVTVADSRLADLREGGIRAAENSEPVIVGNVLERCGPWGILAISGAVPEIRENRVSMCATGIEIDQTGARVSGNEVRDCERGIALTSVTGPEAVRRNRLEDNGTGILAQHFTTVEISDNVVTGGREGVVCFRGAAPPLRNNEIAGNGTGILANQMSNPEIAANRIERNERGVYLHLSSYAILDGNDIVDNGVQIELGNMSLDWERRSGFKPMRGLQQRSQGRAERGREMPGGPTADGFNAAGDGVHASGNWWGEAATHEMAERGPEANLSFVLDGYDTPTRTYEGWEGEYAQDRVLYAPWAPGPVPGAGPRPETPAPKEATP